MNSDSGDGRSRIVGTKQLIKHLELEKIEEVFIAQDAETHVTNRIVELAKVKGVKVSYTPSMQELGKSCGIAVGAAAAGSLKRV